jgi:predicted SnoaL-like aldol condensation-catalyzing enzyme
MTTVLRLSSVALLIAATALPASGQARDNRQRIIEFFAFMGTNQERADQLMTPDYVQHNPRFLRMDEITGAKGSAAWVAAFAEARSRGIQLVALPGIALRNPIILMQDGDLVHAIYRGTRPDPDAPGQTYNVYAFESFRVRGEKFSEHWDQVRLAPGWMTPPPPAANQGARGQQQGARGQGAGGQQGGRGQQAAAPPPAPEPRPGCTATPAQLDANKKLVLSLFERADRPANLRPRGTTRPVVDHIVAECDLVSVVWKDVLPDPDMPSRTWEAFTFDAFRLRGDQVVEHWDERQK